MSAATRAEVLGIVSQVLRCGPCDQRADFFDLGGTSLAALQIVELVHDRFGVTVSLTDFFDAPDLGSIAELVTGAA